VRIIKFSAENVKKLRAVEITPTGSVVEITGPNGQGKSSVLDAIFYAVRGTEGIPSSVVRQGEEKAFVKLELGETATELIVTRHFTAAGTTRLTVESPDGAVFKSPQTMLDQLVGALSFDPLEFIRLKPAEQLNQLRRVVKLEVDLDQLDAKTKRVFDARTETRREVKRLEARLMVLPAPAADTPDELVDTGALVQKLQEAGTFNAHCESQIKDRENRKISVEAARITADNHRKQANIIIDEAEEQIKRIKGNAEHKSAEQLQKAEQLDLKSNEEESQLVMIGDSPAAVDTQELAAQIKQAEVTNLNVQRKKAHQELQSQVESHQKVLNDQDLTILYNNELRQQVITQAKMPVDGLSFGDGEVTLNGLPLGNASSGEQLRVSVALAMAANPKLRILRVKDGSLLDEANLKLLTELAELNDFQVWLERVEDSGTRPSVVMEDGHVAG
jgi:recombinational DNA repair ATPase RecF